MRDAIKAEKVLLQETFASTLNYEGGQHYKVCENQDEPGNIILLSEWESRDRYAQYMEWRKETGILGEFGKTFARPPNIRYFEAIA